MNFTFVDVVACSIVGVEFEAGVTTAPIASPIVYATMLAQARILKALVHIHTFPTVLWIIVKARLAMTSVGAD